MFDSCISFNVTYFPEEFRLVVSCLNAPDATLINVLSVEADSHSVAMAARQGISEFFSEYHFDSCEVM